MEKKYLIGEFSNISGISKRMLRHYDKLDLLTPVALDEENGYRYYHENQMDELNKIQFLRDLGFTLAAIRTLMSTPMASDDFLELLKEKEVMLTKDSDEIKSKLLLTKRTILYLQKQSSFTISSIQQLLDLEGGIFMKAQEHVQMVEKVDLTKLMNRDIFVEKIEEILDRDQNDHYHFITFDIDNFMHVNDFDGYEVGDSVIQNIFTIIIRGMSPLTIRSIDENLTARLGGDECSIFLKNADDNAVIAYVEEVFSQIRAFDFSKIGCSRKVSVSCGIAHGKKPVHVAQLTDQSFKAMIEAKRNGSDRYVTMAYN